MNMLLGLLGSSTAKKGVSSLLGFNSSKTTKSGVGRRRRRRKLTSGQLGELNQIKSILGKTAAANALTFYLK